jgi:hypothetical protein
MLGPCRGGVVRLADPGKVLMIGEGIETCLAAMQATGRALEPLIPHCGRGACVPISGVRFVLGGAHTRFNRIFLAHVRASLCGPVTTRAGEMVNVRL